MKQVTGVVIKSAAALALAGTVAYAGDRSPAIRAEFQRAHPCPANGKSRGACPGWVKDHIVPLCAGGADSPANMQWQTRAAASAKDREEAKLCRARRALNSVRAYPPPYRPEEPASPR